MKSKYMKEYWDVDRTYIECRCGSLEHLIVFEKYKFEEDSQSEISIYLSNNIHLSFWSRIKASFKFIFKKQYNYITHDLLIDRQNIEQLQEWIDEIKKKDKFFHYCVVCNNTNLITFYDSERISTELEKYRYRCLDCGVEFEIKDADKDEFDWAKEC